MQTSEDVVRLVDDLLNNSAKLTLPGGEIALSAIEAGGQVVIRISDNGIGIAKDNLGFIFGLFAQDGHATDRMQDGLGIGLSLVRTLVELHHGSITAHSEGLGQGSRFELTLPTLEQAPPSAMAMAAGFDEHIIKPIAFSRLAALKLHTLR